MSSIKIKKDTSLRKAILQAAITGKLIETTKADVSRSLNMTECTEEKINMTACHSEIVSHAACHSEVISHITCHSEARSAEESLETGKQLLDRIIEERNKKLLAEWEEKLKENPKTKKPTQIVASEITEDEIPFEIPESWCWCRLGELGLYRKGPFGSSLTKSMFVPKSKSSIKVYEQKNAIQKDFSLGDYYISKEKFDSMQSFIVEPEDIIVSCAGTIGEVYKLPKNAPIGIINQALMRVKLYNDELSAFWMLYFDYVLKKEASKQSSGTAIKNIPPFEILKAYPFPLPPLAVQNAIVAKLEEVLPLVDAYENAVLQKEELKNALPDSLKKAILQEAIQGKLTEEWRIEMLKQVQHDGRTEETGKQLLDRIIEERKKMSHGLDFANAKSGKRKSKKETALAGSNPCDIPEDEIPFEIPESWCWCRIEDITTFIGGKNNQIQAKEILKEGKIPVVSQGQSLIDGYSNETQKVINNIPVIMFGDHTRNVKYIDFPFVIGADGTKFLKPILCNEKYIYYLVYFIAQNLRNRGYARHYSLLKEEYLPLPPLAEQKKIVEIIEQMLPLCEKLGG